MYGKTRTIELVFMALVAMATLGEATLEFWLAAAAAWARETRCPKEFT